MHLTLPLLHPPLQARDGGELPGSHSEAGISMQVGWVLSRLLGWCTSWGGRVVGRRVCLPVVHGHTGPDLLHPLPQVAAADEEKGGEEETAGAEGALAYTQMILDALANAGSARGQPCSGTRRAKIEGRAALFRNMRALFCGRLWCSGTKHAFYCLLLPVFRSDLLPCFRHWPHVYRTAIALPRRRRRDRRRDHTALVLLGGAGSGHCGLPALTTTTPHALSAP